MTSALPYSGRPHRTDSLLEHLAVGPRVRLALLLSGLVPRPLIVDKLLVRSAGRVELGELVALVVGSDIEGRESLLPADEEGTANDAVVGDAEDGRGAEDELAGRLEASEEAACRAN